MRFAIEANPFFNPSYQIEGILNTDEEWNKEIKETISSMITTLPNAVHLYIVFAIKEVSDYFEDEVKYKGNIKKKIIELKAKKANKELSEKLEIWKLKSENDRLKSSQDRIAQKIHEMLPTEKEKIANRIYMKELLSGRKSRYKFMVDLAQAIIADAEYASIGSDQKEEVLKKIDEKLGDNDNIKIKEVMNNLKEAKKSNSFYEFGLRLKQSKLEPASIFSFSIFLRFWLQIQISMLQILGLFGFI